MASQPTPYSIALAALITLHCAPESPLYSYNEEDVGKTDAFLQQCLLEQQPNTAKIRAFLRALRESTTESIAAKYTEWLKIAASSIDALTDLVMTIQRAVPEGSVDPCSANGIFLRCVSLGWEELSFEETIQLWKALVKEVELLEDQTSNDYDDDDDWNKNSTTADWPLSTEQCEQVWNAACWDATTTNTPTTSISVTAQATDCADIAATPSAHFYNLITCLQQGERVGAVEALHAYLDATKVHSVSAVLQAACRQSAGLSTHAWEAVRVAQQSSQEEPVALALGWLALQQGEQAHEWMQRCVQRVMNSESSTTTLRPLAAGANFWLALHSLDSTNESPKQTWEYWRDALADPPAEDTDVWERATHLGEAKDQQYLLTRQALIGAAIWDTFGQVDLSRASLATVALHGRKEEADTSLALQNMAQSMLYGSTALQPNNDSELETDLMHSLQIPPEVKSENSANCIYGQALRKLSGMCKDSIDRNISVGLLATEWAIRRGDLSHAQALLCSIQGQMHPRIANYDQICSELASQEALLLTRQGQFEKALAVLRRHLDALKNQPTKKAQVLLQLVLVHLEAHPTKFAAGLVPLQECRELSKLHAMDGLHASILSLWAQVHFRMGQSSRGLGILQSVLPTLLQQSHVWLQGEAYWTMAKCHLQLGSSLESSQQALAQAERIFLQCQDRRRLQKVYYLMARTAHVLGDFETRERASRSMLDIQNDADTVTVDEFMKTVVDDLDQLAARSLPVVS